MKVKHFNVAGTDATECLGYESRAAFDADMGRVEAMVNYAKANAVEEVRDLGTAKAVKFNNIKFAEHLVSEIEKDETGNTLALLMLRFGRMTCDAESSFSAPSTGAIKGDMRRKAIRDALKALILNEMKDQDLGDHDCDTCGRGRNEGTGECPIEDAVREVKEERKNAEVSSGKEALRDALNQAKDDADKSAGK